MAVEIVSSNGLKKEIQCLAADVKPVDDNSGDIKYRIGAGSECLVLDAVPVEIWKYSLQNINPLTGDGWWKL